MKYIITILSCICVLLGIYIYQHQDIEVDIIEIDDAQYSKEYSDGDVNAANDTLRVQSLNVYDGLIVNGVIQRNSKRVTFPEAAGWYRIINFSLTKNVAGVVGFRLEGSGGQGVTFRYRVATRRAGSTDFSIGLQTSLYNTTGTIGTDSIRITWCTGCGPRYWLEVYKPETSAVTCTITDNEYMGNENIILSTPLAEPTSTTGYKYRYMRGSGISVSATSFTFKECTGTSFTIGENGSNADNGYSYYQICLSNVTRITDDGTSSAPLVVSKATLKGSALVPYSKSIRYMRVSSSGSIVSYGCAWYSSLYGFYSNSNTLIGTRSATDKIVAYTYNDPVFGDWVKAEN